MTYASDNLERHLAEVDALNIPEAEKEEQRQNLRARAEGAGSSATVGEWWDRYRANYVRTPAEVQAEQRRARASTLASQDYRTGQGQSAVASFAPRTRDWANSQSPGSLNTAISRYLGGSGSAAEVLAELGVEYSTDSAEAFRRGILYWDPSTGRGIDYGDTGSSRNPGASYSHTLEQSLASRGLSLDQTVGSQTASLIRGREGPLRDANTQTGYGRSVGDGVYGSTGYGSGYTSAGGGTTGNSSTVGGDASLNGPARDAALEWLDLYFTDSAQRQEILGIIDNSIRRGASASETVREIRGSEAYATRFPGMAIRDQAGFRRLSEGEYLGLEEQYRTALRAYDLPSSFYDSANDFGSWIGGDVSPAEVEDRAALAYEASTHADPEVANQLRAYGLSDGDLTAYYLDPQRELSVVEERERQRVAAIHTAAFRGTGGHFAVPEDDLSTRTDERLSGTAGLLEDAGYGEREVQERLAARRGLLNQLHGEEALSIDDLALGEFALDVDSQRRLRRLTSQRAASQSSRTGDSITSGGLFSRRTV